MPTRGRKPCHHPGCPQRVPKGYCSQHEPTYHRDSTTERGLGWDHQRLAAQTIREQPWCAVCGQDRATVEARGDKLTGGHIIARSKGGMNVRENYQTECFRCNASKGAY